MGLDKIGELRLDTELYHQTQLDLYKVLVTETLLRLERIEKYIDSLERSKDIPKEYKFSGLDLRDISETLGL